MSEERRGSSLLFFVMSTGRVYLASFKLYPKMENPLWILVGLTRTKYFSMLLKVSATLLRDLLLKQCQTPHRKSHCRMHQSILRICRLIFSIHFHANVYALLVLKSFIQGTAEFYPNEHEKN